MPHYEIIYETGAKSVAFYEDDEDALKATQAHHLRATKGEPALLNTEGGDPAASRAAERIVSVLKYDEHPGNYGETQAVDVSVADDTVMKALKDLEVGGMVSVHELAARLRDLTNPHTDVGGHASMFKMKEKGDIWKVPA
jgi:hypothetical protein